MIKKKDTNKLMKVKKLYSVLKRTAKKLHTSIAIETIVQNFNAQTKRK